MNEKDVKILIEMRENEKEENYVKIFCAQWY